MKSIQAQYELFEEALDQPCYDADWQELIQFLPIRRTHESILDRPVSEGDNRSRLLR